MKEDLQERLSDKFVEIALRHKRYILHDPTLGLSQRKSKEERIRSFYLNLFDNLGVVRAGQEWIRQETELSQDHSDAEKRYSLSDFLKTLGIGENVVIFRILETFGAQIQKRSLEGRVDFTVSPDAVKEIVTYLQERHLVNYRLLEKKHG